MKKIYTLIIFLCLGITAQSQVTDVITGLGNPSRIVIIDNTMYIADNSAATISSIDYTSSSPVLTTLFSGLSFPYGLHLNGTDIYVTTDTAISKFNYTEATPTLELVVEGLNGPQASVRLGDFLYIAEYFGNQILKIDVASGTTAQEVIAPANAPDQMVLIGTFLYIAEYAANKISKLDISLPNPTPIDVITGLNGPSGLLNVGNDLYFTEYSNNTISKIDITDPNPTVLLVQAGFNGPTDIATADNEFYVVEYSGGKISKFMDTTLSTNDLNPAQTSISIYPNPTTQGLKIAGLNDPQSYAVYSVTGAIIKKGSVSNNQTIDVQNLSNGIYFLKLESGSNFKFIKN